MSRRPRRAISESLDISEQSETSESHLGVTGHLGDWTIERNRTAALCDHGRFEVSLMTVLCKPPGPKNRLDLPVFIRKEVGRPSGCCAICQVLVCLLCLVVLYRLFSAGFIVSIQICEMCGKSNGW